MNTLLFTLEYPPFKGGVSSYYENLVSNWPSRHISVLNNNDGKLLSGVLPIKWLPAIFALWRQVKKEDTDHVIVGQILPLGTVAYLVGKLLGIDYSVILHGMEIPLAKSRPRKKFLAKLILNKAKAVICNSRFTADLASELIANPDKIRIVNPGILPPEASSVKQNEELKQKYGLAGKIVLLTVGRLVKRKGVDQTIKSLPFALQANPNLVYVIVGRGEESANIKAKITKYSLDKQVVLIEDATDEERNAWYNLCDIFIMPSRSEENDFEGFGIVFLEANLAGKPVIAGRSGGVPEAVIAGHTGLLVNPHDKHEIAEAITKLANDADLRHQLGQQGKERAINEFSWQKQAAELFNVITKS